MKNKEIPSEANTKVPHKGYLKLINVMSIIILIMGIGMVIFVYTDQYIEQSAFQGIRFTGLLSIYTGITTLAKRKTGWYLMHFFALAFAVYIVGIFMFIGLHKNKFLYFN
jgi:hypothetical protein